MLWVAVNFFHQKSHISELGTQEYFMFFLTSFTVIGLLFIKYTNDNGSS